MAILKYIGRRLLVLIPVLLGISLAAFLLGRIAPGDPVDDALFRIGIEFPTEEDRADMRAELGHFLSCIRAGKPSPLVPQERILAVLGLLETALEADGSN